MRHLMKHVVIGLAGMLAVACGSAFNGGGGDDGDSGGFDRDGGVNPGDSTYFEFVSYDFLFITVTQTLGVSSDQGDTDNPLTSPLRYLTDNSASLGGPNFDSDDTDQVGYGVFSGAGYKNWLLVSSGAAGIAMDGAKYNEFFPNGSDDYNTVYLTLLGRGPVAEEIAEFDAVALGGAAKATYVATALLSSAEFLTLN